MIKLFCFTAAILKEGGFTLDDLFDSMCIKLGKYLQEAGLVSKSITDIPGLAKVLHLKLIIL